MFISDPDFCPFWIPDPKTGTKEREKISCPTCFGGHKYHRIKNNFTIEQENKKLWADLQRIIELFTQKIVNKLSKIWVWDPRSGN